MESYLLLQEAEKIELDNPIIEKTIQGHKCCFLRLKECDITYIDLLFDIKDLTLEEMRWVMLLAYTFNKMNTIHDSNDVWNEKIAGICGGIVTDIDFFGNRNEIEYAPFLRISVSCLTEYVFQVIEIIIDVVNNISFEDTNLLAYLCEELYKCAKANYRTNRYNIEKVKCLSKINYEKMVQAMIQGDSFCQWYLLLRRLEGHEKVIKEKITEMYHKIICENRCCVCIGSEVLEDMNGRVLQLLETLRKGKGNKNQCQRKSETEFPLNEKKGEYNTQSTNFIMATQCGKRNFSGSMLILEKILKEKYLNRYIRHNIGAYGIEIEFSPMKDFAVVGSYGNPRPQKAVELLKEMPCYVENMKLSEEELISYKVRAIVSLCSMNGMGKGYRRRMNHYLQGMNSDFYNRVKNEILLSTQKEIQENAVLLNELINSPYSVFW